MWPKRWMGKKKKWSCFPFWTPGNPESLKEVFWRGGFLFCRWVYLIPPPTKPLSVLFKGLILICLANEEEFVCQNGLLEYLCKIYKFWHSNKYWQFDGWKIIFIYKSIFVYFGLKCILIFLYFVASIWLNLYFLFSF